MGMSVAVVDRRRLIREGVAAILDQDGRATVEACVAQVAEVPRPIGLVVLCQGADVGTETEPGSIRITDEDDGTTVVAAVLAARSTRAETHPSAAPGPDERPRLTPREITVLRMVGAGQSAQEIAETLEVGARTVHEHKQSVLNKLQAQNQAEAVARATEMGLFEASQ